MSCEMAKRNMYAAAAIFTTNNGADDAMRISPLLLNSATSDQLAFSRTSEVNRLNLALQPRQGVKYGGGQRTIMGLYTWGVGGIRLQLDSERDEEQAIEVGANEGGEVEANRVSASVRGVQVIARCPRPNDTTTTHRARPNPI
jgi:hypothetical protein